MVKQNGRKRHEACLRENIILVVFKFGFIITSIFIFAFASSIFNFVIKEEHQQISILSTNST